MTSRTMAEICGIIGGQLTGDASRRIDHVTIDSRKFTGEGGALFFAIRGLRNDGHHYIQELCEKGLQCLVAEELPTGVPLTEVSVIIVRNSLAALQKLAAYYRQGFTGEVVSITGSNGKTIVKEWIYQALNQKIPVVRSPLSYNSQVGVPLSLFLLEDRYSLAIIEAGISQTGEMDRLEAMIHPGTGILTNIGQAHQENFTSMSEKLEEKMKLFQHCQRLIYCSDHELIRSGVEKLPAAVERISWGTGKDAAYRVSSRKAGSGTEIEVSGRCDCRFSLHYSDLASAENAMHVFVYLHSSGYDLAFISSVMEKLEPVAMRLEIAAGVNHCTLINDTYNSDVVSLANALDVLNQQNQHQNKTLILSDILESGKHTEELYGEVAALLRSKGIRRMIGIGPGISSCRSLFPAHAEFFNDTVDFLNARVSTVFRNEAILLKGSRQFRFERISRILQEKAHRTVLEINLNALVDNFMFYKSLLNRNTRIMAMVKAFSYGSGGYEIANVLQYHHVDYLAVAFADEGVTLRKNGIHIPVMVMNPEENDYFLLSEYNLEPEIYSFRILNDFSQYLDRNGIKEFPVHLKIDTGMHRLGFEEGDTEALVSAARISPVRIVSVFSHLAAAGEAINDPFTHEQINRFRRICERLEEGLGQKFMRHILNSSGIERFPDAALDMVRLGIGLYGVSGLNQDKLREVSTFKTTIAQIREVGDGDTVGYSRQGRIEGLRRIATLPVGYADGLFRSLGNGRGKFLIRGRLAPVVGQVCMDMTMVDITGIPAEENDEVILFGNENPVSRLADAAATIPYEILTRISERVKRIYVQA